MVGPRSRTGRKACWASALTGFLLIGAAAPSVAGFAVDAPVNGASIAEAVRSGDEPAVRRAMDDPRLLGQLAAIGQGSEFLFAIADTPTTSADLRAEALRRGLLALDLEAAQVEAGSSAATTLAGRRLSALVDYAETLGVVLNQRLASLPPQGAGAFEEIQAIGGLRREMVRAFDELSGMVPGCDTPEACARRRALQRRRTEMLSSPAVRAVEHLERALAFEEKAYAALTRGERQIAGGAFRDAEAAFLRAREHLARGRPHPSALGQLADLAAASGDRGRSLGVAPRVGDLRGPGSQDAPIPEPPARLPPPPMLLENASLAALVVEDPGSAANLSPYQSRCREALALWEARNREGERPAAPLQVMYATTRARLAVPDVLQEAYFANSPNRDGAVARITYGASTLSMPCLRARGSINRPPVFVVQLRDPVKGKDVILTDAPIRTRAAWLGEIDGQIAGSKRREMLVFVHGYNSDFTSATYRAAQLQADLGVDGSTVLFSWPSAHNLLAYDPDREIAESDAEAEALASVLDDVRGRGASRIYLTAHSMGNRLLLNALAKLAARAGGPIESFEELVLGSPDVEQQYFSDRWRAVSAQVRRVTLYASNRDAALQAATVFSEKKDQRIGSTYPAPILFPDVQTIDTSAMRRQGWGHDDFSGPGIHDLRGVLWLSLAPQSRCILETVASGGRQYWTVRGAQVGSCDEASFGDAVQLTRLHGTAESARDWVSNYAARPEAAPSRNYFERVVAEIEQFLRPRSTERRGARPARS